MATQDTQDIVQSLDEMLELYTSMLNADDEDFDRLPHDDPMRKARITASLQGLAPENGEKTTPAMVKQVIGMGG